MLYRCVCNNKVYKSLQSFKAHQLTQGHTIYKKLIQINKNVIAMNIKIDSNKYKIDSNK